MLDSYIRNANVGMTKDQYFEMCEALGTEPLDEEIPVEIEDFPPEVQICISIYYKLKDEWDGMNGVYLGKSYAGFADILDALEFPKEDRKFLIDVITTLDAARSKVYNEKRPKSKKEAAQS